MPGEALHPRPAPSLRVAWYKYCERGPEYHTPPHIMDDHEWYHVVRGSAKVQASGKELWLEPGQSVLFAPGSVRAIWAGKKPPAYFASTFAPGGLDLAPVCDRVLEAGPAFDADIQALVSAARHPQPDDEALVQALLVKLMVGFKRLADERATAPPRAPSALNRNYNRELAERAERFLRQHFYEPLTREDVARALSLSPGHLARLYRAVTGQTLHDRITQLRIEGAKALLLKSTHSITQIALEVGYSSFSHFSKTFKDLEGVSPGDYRRASGISWHEPRQHGSRKPAK